jgi:hypothetical protein
MSKAIAAIILAAVMATAAQAQPGDRLMLGAGIGFQNYRDGAFSNRNPAIVPEYRFGVASHSHRDGVSFGLTGGIGYSNPDRSESIGGVETRTGNLRTVQLMAGAGPSYRSGPLRIGVDVSAGPSFNRLSVDDAARTAYRSRLGETLNSIQVQNSLVAGPAASLWYDLTPRLGLHTSVGYTVNRPVVKTTVDGATSSTRWNADSWSYEAGVGFGLF